MPFDISYPKLPWDLALPEKRCNLVWKRHRQLLCSDSTDIVK